MSKCGIFFSLMKSLFKRGSLSRETQILSDIKILQFTIGRLFEHKEKIINLSNRTNLE